MSDAKKLIDCVSNGKTSAHSSVTPGSAFHDARPSRLLVHKASRVDHRGALDTLLARFVSHREVGFARLMTKRLRI